MPGGNGSWQQFSFNEIVNQDFSPVSLGDKFGQTWTTHYFKVIEAFHNLEYIIKMINNN